MKRWILFILLVSVFSGTIFAADRYPFQSLQKKQQFDRLTGEMRCMVCQNESLASSSSRFSEDMRAELYRMVKLGKSDKAIADYMTARYGYFVLFKPPFNWETYLLWLAPLFLLIMAIFIAHSVYKKYRSV